MDSSAVATLLVSHIAQAGDMDDQSVLVDDFDAGIAIIHSFLPFEELSCDLLSLVHGRGDVDQLLAFAVAVPLEVEDIEEVAGHGGLALTKRNAVRCNWFACDPAVQVVISAAVSPAVSRTAHLEAVARFQSSARSRVRVRSSRDEGVHRFTSRHARSWQGTAASI